MFMLRPKNKFYNVAFHIADGLEKGELSLRQRRADIILITMKNRYKKLYEDFYKINKMMNERKKSIPHLIKWGWLYKYIAFIFFMALLLLGAYFLSQGLSSKNNILLNTIGGTSLMIIGMISLKIIISITKPPSGHVNLPRKS